MKNFILTLLLISSVSCSKVSKKEVKRAYNELNKAHSPIAVISELSNEKENIQKRIDKYKKLNNEDIVKQELRELKEIEQRLAEENKRLKKLKKIIKMATSKQLNELNIKRN